MDYIVLSIPVFFILIGLELLISRMQKSKLYRFNDTVSNISCGLAQQISGVFFKTALIVAYLYLFKHYALFEIPNNLLTYTLLFIGIDFFYYWFHRLAHEISLFWGTHIVHHQSEDYNFSVALRQSSFQGFISMFFYLPLAILGFNPLAFVTINAFQTLYQFWIHTKTINKMPKWFEFVFNTPSHHRVHHGRNPKYIDKNHGGTLIIFDRMFGSFQEEEETVVYGVTKPLKSWNPVWANFDWYADLWKDLRQPMSWSDRFRILFKKPGWMPSHLGGPRQIPAVDPSQSINYDPQISPKLNYYILAQYVLLLSVSSFFLFKISSFSPTLQGILSIWIFWTIVNLGAFFDKKKWVWLSEYARLCISTGLFAYLIFSFECPIIYISIPIILLFMSFLYLEKSKQNN